MVEAIKRKVKEKYIPLDFSISTSLQHAEVLLSKRNQADRQHSNYRELLQYY